MTHTIRRVDRSGSVVVEFALVTPILITLLLSIADLAPSLMVRFKLGIATQAVADLATQFSAMTTADIANNLAIGPDTIAPFPSGNLVLRITNVASDGNGNAFVYWSCGQGALAPPLALSPVTSTPTGVISLTKAGTNTSYVVVESQYSYSAPAGFILPSPQIIQVKSYTLPRVSTYIGHTTGDPNYVPPTPTSTHSSSPVTLNGLTCNFAV